MKNTFRNKTLRSALALLVAVVLLVGMVPTSLAAGGKATVTDRVENGLFQKLDGLKVDYSDYLNSDVAFRLPDGVATDDATGAKHRVAADLSVVTEHRAKLAKPRLHGHIRVVNTDIPLIRAEV